jgi:hypothetical protein
LLIETEAELISYQRTVLLADSPMWILYICGKGVGVKNEYMVESEHV